MRMFLAASLAALAAALAATLPGALAQAGEGETLRVETHDAGGSEFWFTIEGLQGRNPVLALEPGRTYTFQVVNVGSTVHNFHLGQPMDEATEYLDPGQEATLTVAVPADATGQDGYWCDPHRAQGMVGTLDYTGQAPTTPTGANGPEEAGEEDAPGPGALAFAVAVVGAALLARGPRR